MLASSSDPRSAGDDVFSHVAVYEPRQSRQHQSPSSQINDIQYHQSGKIAGVLAGQHLYIVGTQQPAAVKPPAVRHVKKLARPCRSIRWRPDGAGHAEVVGVPQEVGHPVALYGVGSSSSQARSWMRTAPEWGRCKDATFMSRNSVVSCFTDGKIRLWDVRSAAHDSVSIDWFAATLSSSCV